MNRFILVVLCFFSGFQLAHAGGFQIPEMGVKAMGMAHAYTAIADDPSANWFNPAGLAFQDGSAVTVGGLAVMPKVDFTANGSNPLAPSTASADRKTIYVPHAYVMIEGGEDLKAGIGINSPFGLEMKWPTTAVFAAAAQYGRLQAVEVNPNVAFRLSPEFAIAAGAAYVNMYQVDFNGTALIQKFSGDGWGYNVAALYKSELFSLGASYRSHVKIKANGTSTHTATGTTSRNDITVTMPDILNLGIAVHPVESLTLSVNADWVNWKKFDQLAFVYTPALAFGALPSLNVPENWKATWAFRVGAEWAFMEKMALRIGYTNDPTPIKDVDFTPLLPGNDRQAVHIGYGVEMSDQVTLDLAYTYVWLSDRNQTASLAPSNWVRNGTYKSSIHLAAASLTMHF